VELGNSINVKMGCKVIQYPILQMPSGFPNYE
jgi:hypothetical protein